VALGRREVVSVDGLGGDDGISVVEAGSVILSEPGPVRAVLKYWFETL